MTDSDSPKSSSIMSSSYQEISNKNHSDSRSDSSVGPVNFTKLAYDKSIIIKRAFHISDIHIRNTTRHDEYRRVFRKLYSIIRKNITEPNESIIVVTGDVVHAKTQMVPELIEITQDLFINLAKIAPVILIPGNHDCNLSNRDRMDALSPILTKNIHIDNLFYLLDGGFYQYHNIVFGVTSIFNKKLLSSNKLQQEIWDSIESKTKYKIALFHGSVHGAKTDVGYRMNNDQLVVEHFDGYDYVMLGDIHKFQYMDSKKRVAYSGSLIQQSYGESLDGHGVLKWDLETGNSNLIQVPNEYGYCKVYITDGIMQETTIPIRPRINFILSGTSQLQYQEVLDSLNKKYAICEVTRDSEVRNIVKEKSKKIKNGDSASVLTQEQMIKSHLEKTGHTKSEIKQITELHQKLYQKILSDKKDQVADKLHNAERVQRWRLLELQFTNMISYGENNVIDFRAYDRNTNIGIVAPNFTGKSAILDILLFCLFDKYSRGDRRDILNKNENRMYCSLLFSIGSETYFIERIGQRSQNGQTVKIDVNLFKTTTEGGKIVRHKLNGLDKNETNRKISALVGTYNDYVTTCFCMQSTKPSNFIDMTQLQKKEYLNEILKLNVFEDCYKLAREKVKKYSAQLKILESISTSSPPDKKKQAIMELKGEINRMNSRINECEKAIPFYELLLDVLRKNPVEPYIIKKYGDQTLKELNILLENVRNVYSQSYASDLSVLEASTSEHQKNADNIRSECDRMSKKLADLCDEKMLLSSQLKPFAKPLSVEEVDVFSLKIQTTNNKITALQDRIASLESDKGFGEKLAEIDAIEAEIKILRSKVKNITFQGNCNCDDYDSSVSIALKLMGDTTKNRSLKYIHPPHTSAALDMRYNSYIIDLATEIKSLTEMYVPDEKSANNDVIGAISSMVSDRLLVHREYVDECNELNTKKNVEERNNIAIHEKILLDNEKKCIKESLDYMDYLQDMRIKRNIECLQHKLDSLNIYRTKQLNIGDLREELNVMIDNKNLYESKIRDNEKNEELKKNHDNLKPKIDEIDAQISEISAAIEASKIALSDIDGVIIKNKAQLDAMKSKYSSVKYGPESIGELEHYVSIYPAHQQYTSDVKNIIELIKDANTEITDLRQKIELKNAELNIYKTQLIEYIENRKKYDDKNTQVNTYQKYIQLTNFNGLPYEILKSYMPIIEPIINRILHSMINFSIEIVIFDEEKLKEQKIKQIKTNMGCVDINISHPNKKPYKAQQGSGFERFIIGLAIRMALSQISLTSKPNFIIIDEGWNTLDAESINNIGNILNYIKSQYEHVVIISHNEELKNQMDYIINIERNETHSFVRSNRRI